MNDPSELHSQSAAIRPKSPRHPQWEHEATGLCLTNHLEDTSQLPLPQSTALGDGEEALAIVDDHSRAALQQGRGRVELPAGKLFYTIREVCMLTGRSRAFISDRIKSGELPAYSMGTRVSIFPADLLAWLAKLPPARLKRGARKGRNASAAAGEPGQCKGSRRKSGPAQPTT